jgi:hypothetical protein
MSKLAGHPRIPERTECLTSIRKLRRIDFGGVHRGTAVFAVNSQIWFMTLYDKDEVEDLSPDEKRLLKAAIEQETRQRTERRGTRRE